VKISFTVKQDLSLVRGCDEPVIAGDITKFRSCSGWTTEIDLGETLRDMLDWWRGQLASLHQLSGRLHSTVGVQSKALDRYSEIILGPD